MGVGLEGGGIHWAAHLQHVVEVTVRARGTEYGDGHLVGVGDGCVCVGRGGGGGGVGVELGLGYGVGAGDGHHGEKSEQ